MMSGVIYNVKQTVCGERGQMFVNGHCGRLGPLRRYCQYSVEELDVLFTIETGSGSRNIQTANVATKVMNHNCTHTRTRARTHLRTRAHTNTRTHTRTHAHIYIYGAG